MFCSNRQSSSLYRFASIVSRPFTKHRCRQLLSLALLSSLVIHSNSLAAGECAMSELNNGLDIKINCLNLSGKLFATNLNNDPVGELSWKWGGSLEEVTCNDQHGLCVQVENGLDLNLPSIMINNQLYSAQLSHANDLGDYAWRYKGAQPKTQPSSNSSISGQQLNSLDAFMQAAIEQNQVPGALMGLAEGNSIIFSQAYGFADRSSQTAMSLDSILHIGSTNKAITSFLVAKLVDEGALTWDTKAIDIYPDFKIAGSDIAAKISIRQLLDMTSGLAKDSEKQLDNVSQLLEGLDSDDVIASPGTQYQYSNLSVSIAAYLAAIAHLKQRDGSFNKTNINQLHAVYEQLLAEKVLQPLGMKDSYLYVDEARNTGKMASSHHLENEAFVVSESVDKRVDIIAPAGGLKSTLADMLAYAMAELNAGKNTQAKQIVSQANTIERQKLSAGPAAQADYGLSLEISSNAISHIGHTGSFDNFNSAFGFFPSKNIAFVILTNGDSPAALNLTSDGILSKLREILSQ